MTYKWNGMDIKVVDSGWYNISTKRIVTQGDRKDLCYMDNPRICGKKEDLEEFKQENTPKPVKKSLTRKFINFVWKKPEHDVSSLSMEQKLSLRPFVLDFSGKGEVIRVIDGDTFDIIVFVSLKDIEKEIKTGRKRESKKCGISRGNGGYFALMRCRLYGVDAAEKDTHHGQFAKEKITSRFMSFGNVVYFVMKNVHPSPDARGRQLMELFSDENFTDSYSKFLLDLRFTDGSKVALPYDGGTKDNYLKNLPKTRECYIDSDVE